MTAMIETHGLTKSYGIALEKVAAVWSALLAMGLLIGLAAFAGGHAFAPASASLTDFSSV